MQDFMVKKMIRSEHMTISVYTRKVTSLNGGGTPTNKSNGIYLELIVSMVMINGKQNYLHLFLT